MTTITREQALKIIEAADEVISALAGTNEDVHPGSDNMLRLWDDLNDRYAPPEVVRELARIVLASLEAEPVLYQSCTRPTWNLRLAMEKEFPDEEWRSADLRKILMELAKNGTVSKDTHASRIGQAVWRLEVR